MKYYITYTYTVIALRCNNIAERCLCKALLATCLFGSKDCASTLPASVERYRLPKNTVVVFLFTSTSASAPLN